MFLCSGPQVHLDQGERDVENLEENKIKEYEKEKNKGEK